MALSNAFKTAAFAQETDDVFLVLLTIAHADISPSIRVVNDNQNITSNSNLFTAFPFDILLPDSKEESVPRAQLSIDNVSREIQQHIRSITTPPTVAIEIIRAEAPDTIEKSWSPFTLRNVEWDFANMTGDLLLENIQIEPFPLGLFSPADFPGVV